MRARGKPPRSRLDSRRDDPTGTEFGVDASLWKRVWRGSTPRYLTRGISAGSSPAAGFGQYSVKDGAQFQ